MSVIGILFEKRIVDDLGFPRTPDRPVELLGTHVRYPRSVKTTIDARGPDFSGGSAIVNQGLAGGPRQESSYNVGVGDVRELVALSEEAPDVPMEGLSGLLSVVF